MYFPFINLNTKDQKNYTTHINGTQFDMNHKGYRTHYDSIPDGDYGIVIGCSYTLGEGVEYDRIYSSLMEKYTNMPIINLGLSGGSNTYILNQFVYSFLLEKIIHKPKFIAIQWPSMYREFLYFKDDTDDSLSHAYEIETTGTSNNHTFRSKLRRSKQTKVWEFIFKREAALQILNSHSVPFFEWSLSASDRDDLPEEYKEWVSPVQYFSNIRDKGTDGAHYGPITHKTIAQFICGNLQKNMLL